MLSSANQPVFLFSSENDIRNKMGWLQMPKGNTSHSESGRQVVHTTIHTPPLLVPIGPVFFEKFLLSSKTIVHFNNEQPALSGLETCEALDNFHCHSIQSRFGRSFIAFLHSYNTKIKP